MYRTIILNTLQNLLLLQRNEKEAVMTQKIYPRSQDTETVYLKNVIRNPNITVGEYTIYNDFVRDPRDFEKSGIIRAIS